MKLKHAINTLFLVSAVGIGGVAQAEGVDAHLFAAKVALRSASKMIAAAGQESNTGAQRYLERAQDAVASALAALENKNRSRAEARQNYAAGDGTVKMKFFAAPTRPSLRAAQPSPVATPASTPRPAVPFTGAF